MKKHHLKSGMSWKKSKRTGIAWALVTCEPETFTKLVQKKDARMFFRCLNLELYYFLKIKVAPAKRHTLLKLVNDQVSVLSHDVTCRVCDTLI